MAVGGTFQNLAQHPAAAGADTVLYLDVPNEVDAVLPRAGVLSVTLAAGETLGTLAGKGCPQAFQDFLARRPGVNLSVGRGQLRAVGALAGQKLLAEPTFNRFLIDQIFDPLFVKHNGQLDQVEITVCTSTAGGTGGSVGPAVGQALAQIFFESTEAIVHMQFVRVGSLSYVGLGDRIHRNGAATLAEDLQYVLSPERHPREVRSLVLCEVPMVGGSKEQRDRFVVQLAQALRGWAVREVLYRCAPNDALDTALGTISIVRAGWGQPLAERRVAADVAAQLLPVLQGVCRVGPRPGFVEGIEIVSEARPAPSVRSVEELLSLIRNSGGVEPPELLEACTEPASVCASVSVQARLRAREALSLSGRSGLLFSTPSRTAGEFTTKFATLRALISNLDREVDTRAGKAQVLRRSEERAVGELQSTFKQCFPRGPLERVKVLLSNPRTTMAQLKSLITGVREVAEKRSAVEAEIQALRSVRGKLAAELEADRARLQRATEALLTLCPGYDTAGAQRLVQARDADEVLEELLEIALRTELDRDALQTLLASSTRTVTLAGLAEITGAAEPRAASVAAQLSQGSPATRAPVWGGKKPLGKGDLIIALPPLAPEIEEELRGILAAEAPGIVAASADSAQGGANVLRLEIHKPRNWEEIFTPFILKNLEKAWQEKELYFTNGFDFQHFLGRLRESCRGVEAPASA